MTARPAAALALLALLLSPCPGGAATIDGQLDGSYGAALVTQTTQTNLASGQLSGDPGIGDLTFANGSELDAAHAVISGGVLSLFLSGNLALMLNANQNGTNGHVLDVFVDSAPGGQNVLNGLGVGHPLNGFTFDAGFEADYWLEFSGNGNQFSVEWYAGYAALQSGGGGSLTSLGFGTAGGNGTLIGGTNPHGIRVTIDNSNIAGVTAGCNASSGAGVTKGIEWEIPLAAIGAPAECFRVTAIVRNSGSSQSPVSNSMLAPLPPGTCPPGPASSVNLAAFAGDQFFAVCPSSTGVPRGASAGLDLSPAGPNPGPGDRLRVAFALPDSRPASLQLFDCGGRVVRSRTVGGSGTADLSEGRALPPGLYWARLSQGAASVVRRLCVLR